MKAIINVETELVLEPAFEDAKPLVIPVPKGTVCRDTGGRLAETNISPACAEVCVASYHGRRIYLHVPLQHLKPAGR